MEKLPKTTLAVLVSVLALSAGCSSKTRPDHMRQASAAEPSGGRSAVQPDGASDSSGGDAVAAGSPDLAADFPTTAAYAAMPPDGMKDLVPTRLFGAMLQTFGATTEGLVDRFSTPSLARMTRSEKYYCYVGWSRAGRSDDSLFGPAWVQPPGPTFYFDGKGTVRRVALRSGGDPIATVGEVGDYLGVDDVAQVGDIRVDRADVERAAQAPPDSEAQRVTLWIDVPVRLPATGKNVLVGMKAIATGSPLVATTAFDARRSSTVTTFGANPDFDQDAFIEHAEVVMLGASGDGSPEWDGAVGLSTLSDLRR